MENRYVVDISILGVMKNLEILILNNTEINEIPKEIGKLINLRPIEILACQYLNRVAKDVISKLRRLEEPRIELTWLGKEIDDRMVMVKNYIIEVKECIVDVMKLSKLTYLDLVLPGDVIPEGFNFGKLKRFGIQIGGFGHASSHLDCHLAIVKDYSQLV
uniref:NB-ARC domains-containing protein n=1 Tax=Tanacetum cinerariifolium TaxID=118510 RepID=A0A6L2M192_TANCI|nr:hypothetical protein [Tanacetum cinerariifolium]